MGFGLDYVKNADKDKLNVNKKELMEQEANSESPSSVSASSVAQPRPTLASQSSSPPASSPTSSSTTSVASSPSRPRSRFARPQANTRQPVQQINQPNKPSDNRPANSQKTPSSASESSAKPKAKSLKLSYSGDEAERSAVSGPTPFQQKGMRARRLVQEVGEFKKWDAVTLEQAERDAMRDPEAAIAQYSSIYLNEVKPFKINCMRSLEEALHKHPKDVVFMLIKKGGKKLCILPSEQAGSQSILNGATLESVPCFATKFEPPSQLFENLCTSEEKKETENKNAHVAAQSPKP